MITISIGLGLYAVFTTAVISGLTAMKLLADTAKEEGLLNETY